MKRTSPATLALLALVGAGVGYLLDHTLTSAGRATFSPSGLLPIMLLLLAAGVLAVAWPVRKSVKDGTRIDPFRAVRVATLARATSLLGAILVGFGGGLGLFLSSRPTTPPLGSIVVLVGLVASAGVLIVAALVAEYFCTLPKDPDDRQPDAAAGTDPAR